MTATAIPESGTAPEHRAAGSPWPGRVTGAAVAASIVTALALATVALLHADLKFDSESLGTTWQAIRSALPYPIGTIVLGTLLLSGRRGMRWVAVAAFTGGTVWLFLFVPFDRAVLPFALAAACAWGLSAAGLALTPGMGAYLRARRVRAYGDMLGPLEALDDADRWLVGLASWTEAQLTSRRERRRVARLLVGWLDQYPAEPDRTATLRTRVDDLLASSRSRPPEDPLA